MVIILFINHLVTKEYSVFKRGESKVFAFFNRQLLHPKIQHHESDILYPKAGWAKHLYGWYSPGEDSH